MNNQITVNEFLNEIQETYKKYFPCSTCNVRLYKQLGTSIVIDCYLVGNKDELFNGYYQNDMFNVCFWMHEEENHLKNATLETILNDNLEIINSSKSYLLKSENKYMSYDSKKLSYRKAKGDYKKILKSLDKFFSNLKDELIKDLEDNKIHDNFKELLISKIK